MNIIRDVLRELVSMFLADARLTLSTLILVAAVAGLVAVLRVGPLVGGGILIFGCLATLVEAASREARRTGRR
jgi:hypothetical protein